MTANNPSQYARGAEHIVGAICEKCQHTNYYDKRILCGSEIRYRTVTKDGVTCDEILVKCQKCGHEMKIEVDCEGYK
jgi:RNase P subunit RPR2